MNFNPGDVVESTVKPGKFFTIIRARRGGGFVARSPSGARQNILTASAWRKAAPAGKAGAGGGKG